MERRAKEDSKHYITKLMILLAKKGQLRRGTKVRERFKIVTGVVVRDPRLERRLIEYNREKVLYGLILAGSVMVLLAILY